MYGDYVHQHFHRLSDEMLERERTSGNLLPEAQHIADEEYRRRQTQPSLSETEIAPSDKPNKSSGPSWWQWILILMTIRAVYMLIKKW